MIERPYVAEEEGDDRWLKTRQKEDNMFIKHQCVTGALLAKDYKDKESITNRKGEGGGMERERERRGDMKISRVGSGKGIKQAMVEM